MTPQREDTVHAVMQWSRTVRLTFSFTGADVQLVSRQSVDMFAPPSESLTSFAGMSGFWYEVQDNQRRVLYRRVVQNPIRFESEIFSNDPTIPLSRRAIDQPHGTFELLVPEVPGECSVVLFSSPLDPTTAGQPAIEWARFPLGAVNKEQRG